jgi:hypothetical protein
VAREFGWSEGQLAAELDDPELLASARQQFETSRDYGTNALPNVLIEEPAGDRRLLFGGYADSNMIVELVRGAATAIRA